MSVCRIWSVPLPLPLGSFFGCIAGAQIAERSMQRRA
jgi:hypothetical protein